MGLTCLDGEPMMCVVLLVGKHRDLLVETGIDWDQYNNIKGDEDNDSEFIFFKENFGDKNLFPGGPTCKFKGKEVPCFIKFTDNGGMDGETLTEIFKKMDSLGLYDNDRANGKIPFVLLDGHQSRFHLDFLRYINDDKTKWNVCIGVPYGTAFWQVGDSSEQNGLFKTLLTKEKTRLFNERMEMCQQGLQLLRTDIIPLVNATWPQAFANVQNNKKALVERGWFPFNRNLLLNDIIRATITKEQIQREKDNGLCPSKFYEEIDRKENLNFEGGGVPYIVQVPVCQKLIDK